MHSSDEKTWTTRKYNRTSTDHPFNVNGIASSEEWVPDQSLRYFRFDGLNGAASALFACQVISRRFDGICVRIDEVAQREVFGIKITEPHPLCVFINKENLRPGFYLF